MAWSFLPWKLNFPLQSCSCRIVSWQSHQKVAHFIIQGIQKDFYFSEFLWPRRSSEIFPQRIWCCDVDISYFSQLWFSFVIVIIYSFYHLLYVCYPQSHFWIIVVCAFNWTFFLHCTNKNSRFEMRIGHELELKAWKCPVKMLLKNCPKVYVKPLLVICSCLLKSSYFIGGWGCELRNILKFNR